MSVSVSMPQLGESVTEGTVTRWLKHEGDHVSADEPLLEVSTDKVDTEIPSPVSGVLRGITVAEDETVEVGAELAVIDEDGAAGGGQDAGASAGGGQGEQAAPPRQDQEQAPAPQARQAQEAPAQPEPAQPEPAQPEPAQGHGYQRYESPYQQPYRQEQYQPQQYQGQAEAQQAPAPSPQPAQPAQPGQPESYEQPAVGYQPATGYEAPPSYAGQGQQSGSEAYAQPGSYQVPPPAEAQQAPLPPASYQPPAGPDSAQPPGGPAQAEPGAAEGAESPYVTPLVRKLAAEHGIDLAAINGTGVGGRIRKQDVLDAAREQRGAEAPRPAAQPPQAAAAAAPRGGTAPAPGAPAAQVPEPAAGPGAQAPRTIPVPSSLRGTTERLPRARQVIAQRMVESLQTSAQLTTVVEADVTAIARLRDRHRAAFEAREGVKLSFLPFFALATVEALKAHPKLNAVIDTSAGTVTYNDAEHLGIAVDTERGLMVPVIRNAGDLNIGGLARKIADLAARTRAGQVSPDDLSGGTFTLTNTGSRGALFDTPIINQPQVGILGTGTVNKRAVVVDDPDLGEVITVRSILYLALTYDHRLVDGADAARFLVTIKNRLEEGAFEAELGR
jgi:pyruvate dehydrogenase E2 component (dihydrolipoyllysine-residue acetyltransferase)